MSKVNIYSVFDHKAGCYGVPLHFQNHAVASRESMDAVNDPHTAFHKHASDYSLFHLGEFDLQSGKFTLNESPQHLFGFHEIQAQIVT